jgi:hypothetical protein
MGAPHCSSKVLAEVTMGDLSLSISPPLLNRSRESKWQRQRPRHSSG